MNWKSTATWTTVAAILGALVASVVPQHADMLAGYGDIAQGVAAGIAAALTAFVVAARAKK